MEATSPIPEAEPHERNKDPTSERRSHSALCGGRAAKHCFHSWFVLTCRLTVLLVKPKTDTVTPYPPSPEETDQHLVVTLTCALCPCDRAGPSRHLLSLDIGRG